MDIFINVELVKKEIRTEIENTKQKAFGVSGSSLGAGGFRLFRQ